MRSSARLILQQPWNSHITDLMNSKLHWLDIRARIDFKLCLLAFRCLNNSAPRYLASLCTPRLVLPEDHIYDLLDLPSTNSRYLYARQKRLVRERSRFLAPPAGTRCPPHMRSMNRSLAAFRRELKTVLFVSMLERPR